jgi:hypothetical protein
MTRVPVGQPASSSALVSSATPAPSRGVPSWRIAGRHAILAQRQDRRPDRLGELVTEHEAQVGLAQIGAGRVRRAPRST